MAYLALYRKWRPQTFDEIVGQTHISIPIGRALSEDRLAHAYLFSGPRGTGKTSLAKILAKAVNCEHPLGVNPCNECKNCREITSGASMDVYEIDAASNRGIEEIRALRESVRSLPSVCKKKVYIIDEVHMLTKEAFNALLKTLEEPPSHVLFILATTEPEKIPLTILSRCQRYEFRRISAEDIKKHLLKIAEADEFSLTDEAADLLSVRAEGGLRDALSLLDQCRSAAGDAPLTASLVYDLLGLTGKEEILALASHILRRENAEALGAFHTILQNGKEPAAVLSDLLSHFRDVLMAKIDENAPELSVYGDRKPALLSEAASLAPSYLDALFESLSASLSETKQSSAPRMNAEMAILRLCRLREARTLEGLLHRLETLEEALAQGRFQEIAVPASPLPTHAVAPPAVAPPAVSVPETTIAKRETKEEPKPKSVSEQKPPAPKIETKDEPPKENQTEPVSEKPTESIPAEPTTPKADASPVSETTQADGIDPAEYDALWKKILSHFMQIRRIDLFNCFAKTRLLCVEGGRAVIEAPLPLLVQLCNNEANRDAAAAVMKQFTGRTLTLRTVLAGSPEAAEAKTTAESLRGAAPAKPKEPGRQATEKSALPDDPLLAAALKIAPDCDIYVED